MFSKLRSTKTLISAMGLALVASLALSAVAVASASASDHWYAGGTELAEGVPTGQVSSSSGMTIGTIVAGVHWAFPCKSETGTGTVENPFGGGAGVDREVNLSLTGCTVTPPAFKCTISSQGDAVGTIWMRGLKGITEGSTVKFEPESGSRFVTFETHGAECKLGNGTLMPLEGVFTGTSTSSGTLVFSAYSGLTMGGNPVSLDGVVGLTTSEGKALTVAP